MASSRIARSAVAPASWRKPGAHDARDRLLPVRDAVIADRLGGNPEQRFTAIAAPGEQRRILPSQLRQPFDVVVVNGTLRFGGGPIQALAFLAHHRCA
jgi:hypothetical protein